ncbi:MAG: LysR family transcriptional regulator [Oscillibacter sp.]|nr:LysR family transcriptional regulator [Oscillibacter sp.]
MDLRVLRYFLAVAREESITAAAESLHLSQPTLSRQLMGLEAELGKPLFLRGRRKITLTEHGMLLRKRAGEILDLVDKTLGELTALEDSVAGDVFIGAGETEGVHFLTRTARRLQEQYPLAHFHISSGDAVDVMEQLDKGLIDFGLVFGHVDEKKYSSLVLPTYDTWGIIMRRDDPLAEKDSLSAAEMAGKPLIVSQSAPEPGALFGQTISKNVVASYSLAYNGSLMVSDGLGYMLCLDKIINVTGDSPLCFRPLVPLIKAHMRVIWRQHSVFSKASAAFLRALKEERAKHDGSE